MDSAKIFALGLAAGLAIHVFVRNSSAKKSSDGQPQTQTQASIANKAGAKKNKNKKKSKDATAISSAAAAEAPAEAVKQVVSEIKQVVKPQPAVAEAQAPAASSKKNKKKAKQAQQQQQQATAQEDSYAAVAETTPALNNETVRAKADAAQTAFVSALGDMRDADVDPLPSGYSSVARIPAPEAEKPKPKLSKQDVDDGWSSVGGTFSSAAKAQPNGSGAANGTSSVKSSIASTNPFAALPDDATTSSVRRIPSKPATSSKATNGGGWTVASSTPKAKANGNVVGAGAETKKQRSNANKSQAKKAAKEEADRLQAERLANHRRQQALDAAKQREAAKRPTPHSVGSSKVPTAKASVDLNGRLVWD